MKDLALPDHVPALRAAGVSCFKIEGRKKSPLYVATATDFYRKLIDGRGDEAERALEASDLQTAFGRPWRPPAPCYALSGAESDGIQVRGRRCGAGASRRAPRASIPPPWRSSSMRICG